MLEEKNTSYMEKSVEWEEESKKTSALKSQIEVYKRQVRYSRLQLYSISQICLFDFLGLVVVEVQFARLLAFQRICIYRMSLTYTVRGMLYHFCAAVKYGSAMIKINHSGFPQNLKIMPNTVVGQSMAKVFMCCFSRTQGSSENLSVLGLQKFLMLYENSKEL